MLVFCWLDEFVCLCTAASSKMLMDSSERKYVGFLQRRMNSFTPCIHSVTHVKEEWIHLYMYTYICILKQLSITFFCYTVDTQLCLSMQSGETDKLVGQWKCLKDIKARKTSHHVLSPSPHSALITHMPLLLLLSLTLSFPSWFSACPLTPMLEEAGGRPLSVRCCWRSSPILVFLSSVSHHPTRSEWDFEWKLRFNAISCFLWLDNFLWIVFYKRKRLIVYQDGNRTELTGWHWAVF